MPVNVQWDNEDHSIILFRFEEAWTLADLTQAYAETRTLLDSIDHAACILMDLHNTHMVPTGITGTFGQARAIGEHPHTALVVGVGANLMVRTIGGIYVQLFPHLAPLILFADTLQEARKQAAARLNAG